VKLDEVHEVKSRPEFQEFLREGGNIRPQDFQSALLAAGIPSVNLYQELEMNSRYVNAHSDVNYSGDIIQLHSHSFYEILYTRSGTVQYLLGNERYSLKQGDIVFVPPGLSHRPLISEPVTEPYCRYVLWLSAEYIEQVRSILSEPDAVRTRKSPPHFRHLHGRNTAPAFPERRRGKQPESAGLAGRPLRRRDAYPGAALPRFPRYQGPHAQHRKTGAP